VTTALTPDATYPWMQWPQVSQWVDRAWDPENVPHHSIIGLTGCGKSYLAVNGILRPMCAMDRVLLVDTKGDDPIVSKQGRPVKALETRRIWQGRARRKEPYDQWQRLVVSDDRTEARGQVRTALNRAYEEGHWVVYVDEAWDICSKDPDVGLNLGGPMARIWRKGRGRHVSLVAATQTPVEVPRLFYDQASFAWIGRIRDEERQKRLLEIGGMSKKDLPVLATLQRRQWLLAADNGEFFARTHVTTRG
jgi:DNA helicase HerA-like ATPase